MGDEYRFRKVFPEVERRNLYRESVSYLWSKAGQPALDYLMTERKFARSTLKKFKIGYIPQYFKRDDGKKHELAGRITLPIFDQYGEIIAFSSRDLNKESKLKFWHESYKKPFYLYGLHESKSNIIKNNKVVIVEGQTDTMQMHNFGITCTVGILGSAFHLYQISLLARYCSEIFLMFDTDYSGQSTIKKAIKMYKSHKMKMFGINFYPVYLPSIQKLGLNDVKKIDPDIYLNMFKKQGMLDLLRESRKNKI